MKRTAQAVWSGALKDGKGAISLQSGALKDNPLLLQGALR